MGKELKLTVVIYLFAAAFALGTFSLNIVNRSIPMTSPVGANFSILPEPASGEKPKYRVYGFLPYWMLQNTEYLQLDKLTDIAYFALGINADGTFKTTDPEGFADPGYDRWKKSEALKELIRDSKAAGVNFALTIISHEDETTYKFLDCQSCWDNLLRHIEHELKEGKIRDVNVDFELSEPNVKDGYDLKYTEFVSFLNTKLDVVTVSVLADSLIKPRITNIESLARAADYLFVMAYDFHRPDSDNAGPVAPIGGAGSLSEYDISTMLSDFLKIAPAEKLILGVPYYGYNWLVTSGSEYSERIPGTDELGYSISQSYADIAETRLKYDPEILWDSVGLVPYFTYFNPEFGATRQVYFENIESLAIKYDLAKAKGLAGIGIWALGYDGGYQELWGLLGETFRASQ